MNQPPYGITAVLDDNILYPAPLRDFLLSLAYENLFEPKWTDAIQEEWLKNPLLNRPDLRRDNLEKTQYLMNKAFRQANITGYEHITDTLSLPDQDDRHVLAAAIHEKAERIITANLKDFHAADTPQHTSTIQHPDNFVTDHLQLNQQKVLQTFFTQLHRLKSPPIT